MLEEKMNTLLADTFCFSAKVQDFHWNVTGPTFPQLHDLFGEIYTYANSSVDTIAELIRQMDKKVDGRVSTFLKNTSIKEESDIDDAKEMIKCIIDDNVTLMASQLAAYQEAEDAGEVGISNIVQDLISQHQKFEWFLKATIK